MTLTGVGQETRQLPWATKLRRLDLPGVVLIVGAVTCLVIALQDGSVRVPWSSSQPIGLFVGFGLLMILFGAWQCKAGDNATIPVAYLRDRTVIWGSLYLFWDNMASYIVSKLFPDRTIIDDAADNLLSALLLPSNSEQFAFGERRALHGTCRASDDWTSGWWWDHHRYRSIRKKHITPDHCIH